eukprot:TRINITY_DN37001_c0_g1_i1.p5 TRINITY_DN37001_c0_g1~~TRINITY_DN37001_c0_g1_i1.p5  ORF type:complete len:116 (+),score=29.60 TRINITY_DN37001_c0_g1_i1:543-890(+)
MGNMENKIFEKAIEINKLQTEINAIQQLIQERISVYLSQIEYHKKILTSETTKLEIKTFTVQQKQNEVEQLKVDSVFPISNESKENCVEKLTFTKINKKEEKKGQKMLQNKKRPR